LFEQDRADEADDGVGEDADHLRAPLDLAVEGRDTFEGTGAFSAPEPRGPVPPTVSRYACKFFLRKCEPRRSLSKPFRTLAFHKTVTNASVQKTTKTAVHSISRLTLRPACLYLKSLGRSGQSGLKRIPDRFASEVPQLAVMWLDL
jgi:hypothetical protein